MYFYIRFSNVNIPFLQLYGGVVSSLLLSALARVFTYFLQIRGFTLGVEDIIVKKKPDEKRKKIMRKGRRCGHEVATAALALPEETSRFVPYKSETFQNISYQKGIVEFFIVL